MVQLRKPLARKLIRFSSRRTGGLPTRTTSLAKKSCENPDHVYILRIQGAKLVPRSGNGLWRRVRDKRTVEVKSSRLGQLS